MTGPWIGFPILWISSYRSTAKKPTIPQKPAVPAKAGMRQTAPPPQPSAPQQRPSLGPQQKPQAPQQTPPAPGMKNFHFSYSNFCFQMEA